MCDESDVDRPFPEVDWRELPHIPHRRQPYFFLLHRLAERVAERERAEQIAELRRDLDTLEMDFSESVEIFAERLLPGVAVEIRGRDVACLAGAAAAVAAAIVWRAR